MHKVGGKPTLAVSVLARNENGRRGKKLLRQWGNGSRFPAVTKRLCHESRSSAHHGKPCRARVVNSCGPRRNSPMPPGVGEAGSRPERQFCDGQNCRREPIRRFVLLMELIRISNVIFIA